MVTAMDAHINIFESMSSHINQALRHNSYMALALVNWARIIGIWRLKILLKTDAGAAFCQILLFLEIRYFYVVNSRTKSGHSLRPLFWHGQV